MAKIVVHVFSGVPDPMIEISGEEARQLRALVSAATLRAEAAPRQVLGYRGMTLVDDRGEFGIMEGVSRAADGRGLVIDEDRRAERFAAEFLSRLGLAPTVRQHILDEIHRKPKMHDVEGLSTGCATSQAVDAPTYAPGNWNIPAVQPRNNCYNYANDQATNTFAQPGRGTGHPISALSCSGVRPSAVSDGLGVVPDFSGKLSAGSGWYVALVIWPNVDYHWYRQDATGCWSHKPGQTAVRDVDNSGAKIADPKNCDRGPYTAFCDYMVTKRTVTIR